MLSRPFGNNQAIFGVVKNNGGTGGAGAAGGRGGGGRGGWGELHAMGRCGRGVGLYNFPLVLCGGACGCDFDVTWDVRTHCWELGSLTVAGVRHRDARPTIPFGILADGDGDEPGSAVLRQRVRLDVRLKNCGGSE